MSTFAQTNEPEGYPEDANQGAILDEIDHDVNLNDVDEEVDSQKFTKTANAGLSFDPSVDKEGDEDDDAEVEIKMHESDEDLEVEEDEDVEVEVEEDEDVEVEEDEDVEDDEEGVDVELEEDEDDSNMYLDAGLSFDASVADTEGDEDNDAGVEIEMHESDEDLEVEEDEDVYSFIRSSWLFHHTLDNSQLSSTLESPGNKDVQYLLVHPFIVVHHARDNPQLSTTLPLSNLHATKTETSSSSFLVLSGRSSFFPSRAEPSPNKVSFLVLSEVNTISAFRNQLMATKFWMRR
ncbi:hypothetical protein EV360DRAFT_76337 [Lentinula raphanica]|nr:hypothetical protein EV360DRAFT_76337 [Lentinula raphanica]